jgi:hypothetical protein
MRPKSFVVFGLAANWVCFVICAGELRSAGLGSFGKNRQKRLWTRGADCAGCTRRKALLCSGWRPIGFVLSFARENSDLQVWVRLVKPPKALVDPGALTAQAARGGKLCCVRVGANWVCFVFLI